MLRQLEKYSRTTDVKGRILLPAYFLKLLDKTKQLYLVDLSKEDIISLFIIPSDDIYTDILSINSSFSYELAAIITNPIDLDASKRINLGRDMASSKVYIIPHLEKNHLQIVNEVKAKQLAKELLNILNQPL